ncbi:MAG TPA: hypothetical protein VIG30_06180 [Ktedonobacterales bacterium]|jgi:hypothetical protein
MPQDQQPDAQPIDPATTDSPLGSYDPLAEVDPRLAGIKRSGPWVAIQLGVPIFAAGSGLACYYFLTTFAFNAYIAVAVGFVFALLVRVAARSLLIEWLVARARQHAAAKTERTLHDNAEPLPDDPARLPEDTPHARR